MRTYKPIEGVALPSETLAQAINRLTRSHRGDTYQNGVKPGPVKLEQFREAMRVRGVPALYAQEDTGEATIAHLKLFNPCGQQTYYITEYSDVAPDGATMLGFGLVDWHEEELGYIPIEELASTPGGPFRIGIEIDMHWKPRPLSECYKAARKAVEA